MKMQGGLWTLFALLSLLGAKAAVPGFADRNVFPGESWETGVIDLGNGGDDIFYYLFRSRAASTATTPLVFWFTGGPGCSLSTALFAEVGPYVFDRQGKNYHRNPHAWNEIADVVFVDQPVGVGFSHAKTPHACRDQHCVARNFQVFVRKLLALHSEFVGRPIYLTGTSYAGKYVPAMSRYLLEASSEKGTINLKGALIGGGMINRFIQRSSDPLYYYQLKYTNLFQYLLARTAAMICNITESVHMRSLAFPICLRMFSYFKPQQIINEADIRETRDYGDIMDSIENFVREPAVKKAFGVADRAYDRCSDEIESDFHDDFMVSQDQTIGFVLDRGVKVMLYFGECDGASNWLGGGQVADGVRWKGQDQFGRVEYQEWKSEQDGKAFAQIRRHKNFSLVKFFAAGHLTGMNQPEYSLEMLRYFVQQQ